MKRRNNAFDLLCGLCIIRMVMLHVISTVGLRNEFWFAKLMAWSFFFLCFFFFKAGYFNKTVYGDSRAFCLDKAKRLLLPYAVWGAIGSVIYFSFVYIWPEYFPSLVKQFRWHHLWRQSHFYGNPPCWFLFSFFATYAIVHFMRKWKYLSMAFSYLWILLPWLSYWLFTQKNPLWMSLSNVPMGIFMFQLGHLWHRVEERLPKVWFIGLSIALTLLFAYGNRHWHGEYDMSLNQWVQRPWGCMINSVAALCGLSGILLSVKRLPRIPVVNFIGEHSMVFFVGHYPLIFLYRFISALCHHNIRHHWDDFYWMMLIIFTLCFLAVPLVERIPWMSGRWPKPASQTKNPPMANN